MSSLCMYTYVAVKSIKKQHLVEVRAFARPPKIVKMAMESICLLIGEPTTDWKSIRSILIRDNFIPTILNFSTEDISYVCYSLISGYAFYSGASLLWTPLGQKMCPH